MSDNTPDVQPDWSDPEQVRAEHARTGLNRTDEPPADMPFEDMTSAQRRAFMYREQQETNAYVRGAVVVHTTHHDSEQHAKSYNEGYSEASEHERERVQSVVQELRNNPRHQTEHQTELTGMWDSGYKAALGDVLEGIAEENGAGALTDNAIPAGYEPAEVSAAKNHVYDALENALDIADREGIGVDRNDVDLIDMANRVVEHLLAAGVIIPEGIEDPHQWGDKAGSVL